MLPVGQYSLRLGDRSNFTAYINRGDKVSKYIYNNSSGLHGQTSGNMQRRKPVGHWHLASWLLFVSDDTIHRNTTINLAT
jgi:hypothetical protein